MGCTMSQEEIFHQTNQQNFQAIESKLGAKASFLIIHNNEPDEMIQLWSKVAEAMTFDVHLISLNYQALNGELINGPDQHNYSVEYFKKLHADISTNSQRLHPFIAKNTTGLQIDIVLIDMRNEKFENLGNSICQYFRAHLQHSTDIIFSSFVSKESFNLKTPGSSVPIEVLGSGFNKYIVATTNLTTIVREFLILLCNDYPLIRRARSGSSGFKYPQSFTSANESILFASDNSKLNVSVQKNKNEGESSGKDITYSAHLSTENLSFYQRLSDFMQDHSHDLAEINRSKKWTISLINKMTNFIISDREVKSKIMKTIRKRQRSKGSTSAEIDEKSITMGKRKESWARVKAEDYNNSTLYRVVQMLQNVQMTSNPHTSKDIQNVLDILLNNELFCGILKANQEFDQSSDDFIAALLTNFDKGKQRDEYKKPPVFNVAIKLDEIPENIEKALEDDDSWDFDVINLERISKKRPLFYLGMKTFARFGIVEFLKCGQKSANSWLNLIESNYHASNTYHNSTHATDVMQSCAYLLQKESINDCFTQEDFAVTILAAIAHDIDHPGKTNQFLVLTKSNLAILYNDIAVLENHHASFTFRITFQHKDCNIFEGLDSITYKTVRSKIVNLILATELSAHNNHLQQFITALSQPMIKRYSSDIVNENAEIESSQDEDIMRETFLKNLLSSDENRMILKRMIIKCSDVNNPTRNRKLCLIWAQRIAEEYFEQMDEEIALGFEPITMPPFNRKTCNLAITQVKFFEFFLMKMFPALDSVINCPELLDNFDSNLNYWKAEADKTSRTV